MIHHVFASWWSVKKQRALSYKNRHSLSYSELIRQIFLRIGQIIWDKIRRYLLLIKPNYDFYGWQTRSLEQVRDDLFSQTAESKNEYMETQVDFTRISSFLELGSNSGIQLFELARRYPNCKFLGIDFNQNSVDFASERAEAEGLKNLTFSVVDLQDDLSLQSIKETSWDVIFSWASLIYIHPNRIINLIDYCLKKSQCLILIEQHKDMRYFIKGRLIPKQPTWLRDYAKLVKVVGTGDVSIKVKSIPNHIWNPGGGYASQIEVRITGKEVTNSVVK
jgi:SAM-dependent methyltransferase